MRTDIPERLLRIASDIEEKGPQNLTRLTVLKPWFSDPIRLASFAIFIANRASCLKGKAKGEEAALFRKARKLMKEAPACSPPLPRKEAERLFDQLSDYQNEHKRYKWGTIRIIKNHNLYLVEEGLRIYLWDTRNPSSGYRLAVDYCQNYSPAYGNMLDKKSLLKIKEMVGFMFTYEVEKGKR